MMPRHRSARALVAAAAAALAQIGKTPSHILERTLGVFAAGWGLVAIVAPRMFESGPYVYAALADGGDEWGYGLLFLAVGLAQALLATPETPDASHLRRRIATAVAVAMCFVGLGLAFASTGAWSGAYTYSFAAGLEVLTILRLRFLLVMKRRGIQFTASRTFLAQRQS